MLGYVPPVSYTHLDVYKRQLSEFRSDLDRKYSLGQEQAQPAAMPSGTLTLKVVSSDFAPCKIEP